MSMTLDQLESLMKVAEGEHLEFKEAKQNFHFDKLVKYCAALANEGGGRIVLGVTDRRPRKVVGCQAFGDLGRTKAGLIERLRLRVEAEALSHADGRVVIFEVPSRPAASAQPPHRRDVRPVWSCRTLRPGRGSNAGGMRPAEQTSS